MNISLPLRIALPNRCLFTPRYQCMRNISHRHSGILRRSVQQSFIRPIQQRFNTSLAVPESEAAQTHQRPEQPSYQLTFTCKPCKHRSAHMVTKHGYHKGTVLITCPSCKNRHVISDHLKIFMDEKSTLEDILKRNAGTDADLTKLLKKGKLGMRQGELVGREGDEDVEFWDDGSESQHTPSLSTSPQQQQSTP